MLFDVYEFKRKKETPYSLTSSNFFEREKKRRGEIFSKNIFPIHDN
jgi:hypothetical protein